MKAIELINDIKWRINDINDSIKWLKKQLETTSSSEVIEDLKDQIMVKYIQKEALEMVLRGFDLI